MRGGPLSWLFAGLGAAALGTSFTYPLWHDNPFLGATFGFGWGMLCCNLAVALGAGLPYRAGPSGPPGPQGPMGMMGPPGPPCDEGDE